MTDFEVMDIMASENKDIRMNGNVIEAKKAKGGGRITFGVDENTFNLIINQMVLGKTTTHYVAIYVVNKQQFDEIKNRKQ